MYETQFLAIAYVLVLQHKYFQSLQIAHYAELARVFKSDYIAPSMAVIKYTSDNELNCLKEFRFLWKLIF